MPALADFYVARVLAVLQSLTLLFFVAGSAPFLTGRRRQLRRLTIAAYAGAVLLALVWVVLWLVRPAA